MVLQSHGVSACICMSVYIKKKKVLNKKIAIISLTSFFFFFHWEKKELHTCILFATEQK